MGTRHGHCASPSLRRCHLSGDCDQLGAIGLLLGRSMAQKYARLVDEWFEAIGPRPEEYGTHSLLRTKASIIYKATGNIRAIQILLVHSKIENMVQYLGVDIENALTLAEKTEI